MANNYDAKKNGNSGMSDSSSPPPMYGEKGNVRPRYMTRLIDGFRKDPNAHVTARGAVGADGKVFDSEGAARATAESPLARKLKGRHLQMIAIGGSIGKPGVHISPQGAYGNPIQVQASLSALARLLKLAGLPHCSSHSV
jgi:yeast amino acid transporter